MHGEGKGYLLCSTCGHMLTAPPPVAPNPNRGRQRPRVNPIQAARDYGHGAKCARRGEAPRPLGITSHGQVEVLRLLVPVPSSEERWKSWGLSLGYALLNGIQHHFMLGANELDFELEGPWEQGEEGQRYHLLSLAFIDPSLGGSGYLPRIAEDFHRVAQRTIEHLDHEECQTACYRCLKTYYNQRFHDQLAWPQTISRAERTGVGPLLEPLPLGTWETSMTPPRGWKHFQPVSARPWSSSSCGSLNTMGFVLRNRYL